MGNYDFESDLDIAKVTELEIAKMLEKLGAKVSRMGDTKDGDILVRFPKDADWSLVECKEDFRAWETGNVPLEFQSRGKPSGIMATKSKYWIYKIVDEKNGDKYFFLPVKRLRRMIEKMLFKRVVNGGDKDSNTMMFLFPLKVFEEYGVEVSAKTKKGEREV